jgi:hypothetical protein
MFLRYNTRKKDGKVHRYWSAGKNRSTYGAANSASARPKNFFSGRASNF